MKPLVLLVFDFESVRALACVKANRMRRNVQIPEHHHILFEGDLVIMLSELSRNGHFESLQSLYVATVSFTSGCSSNS